jgi:hypothetical protein
MANYSGFSETFRGYKAWARRRGLPFQLSSADASVLFAADCAYCGAPPSNEMHRGRKTAFRYSGIDRRDNALGYVPGNVVSCCKTCNVAKQGMSLQDFQSWIRRAYARLPT